MKLLQHLYPSLLLARKSKNDRSAHNFIKQIDRSNPIVRIYLIFRPNSDLLARIFNLSGEPVCKSAYLQIGQFANQSIWSQDN